MPNTQAPPVENPQARAEPVADDGHDGHLQQRARNRDLPDGPEIAEREMQADAEHQQDDAELRELADGDSGRPRNPGVNGPRAMPATM